LSSYMCIVIEWYGFPPLVVFFNCVKCEIMTWIIASNKDTHIMVEAKKNKSHICHFGWMFILKFMIYIYNVFKYSTLIMFIPNYIICFHNIWVTYSYKQINHFQHYTKFEWKPWKKSCISIALVLINVIAPSFSYLWIGIVIWWRGGWFFNLMHVLFT
jgi:hypothetical protein